MKTNTPPLTMSPELSACPPAPKMNVPPPVTNMSPGHVTMSPLLSASPGHMPPARHTTRGTAGMELAMDSAIHGSSGVGSAAISRLRSPAAVDPLATDPTHAAGPAGGTTRLTKPTRPAPAAVLAARTASRQSTPLPPSPPPAVKARSISAGISDPLFDDPLHGDLLLGVSEKGPAPPPPPMPQGDGEEGEEGEEMGEAC